MKSTRLFALGCNLIVLALLLWYAQLTVYPFWVRPDPDNLPLYPYAQQQQTSGTEYMGFAERITTSFITEQSADDVLAFYRTQLIANGWRLGGIDDQEGKQLGFTATGCPFYYIYVIVEQKESKRTYVEVQLNKELCR